MNHIKLIIYGIILGLTVIACGSKSSNAEVSPDDSYGNGFFAPENLKLDSTKLRDDLDELVSDLNQEIKAIKSELAYYNEELVELKAQNKIWTNPFAIYNKEIILENGSSIFGKIVYQDQDVMKVETLIGHLIINRNTIVRVVNQINSYNKFSDDLPEYSVNINSPEPDKQNLITKRIESQSAQLLLVGDITEKKDESGNTVLSGEVKNVGNKRADFSKIIFTFRMNWQGDTKNLTTFVNGVTNTFSTGISSDNSILPHAVGSFELIIPKSFGLFIGYSYNIDWNQYDE